MNDPNITLIVVSWYSSELLSGMIHNVFATAMSKDIKILICDNTDGIDTSLRHLESERVEIIPFDPGFARMSRAHALGLQRVFQEVRSKYCVTIEPDCRVLYPGWDLLCRNALQDGAVAIGAPYPYWKLGKYHRYPGPHFNFFLTDSIKGVNGAWHPDANLLSTRVKDFLLRQFILVARLVDRVILQCPARSSVLGARCERLVGVVSKDTGWRIATSVSTKGWNSKLFDVVRSIQDIDDFLLSSANRVAFEKLATDSELYLWGDRPIVTHFNPTKKLFDIYLWSGRPLVQVKRTWSHDSQISVQEWDALCKDIIRDQSTSSNRLKKSEYI